MNITIVMDGALENTENFHIILETRVRAVKVLQNTASVVIFDTQGKF